MNNLDGKLNFELTGEQYGALMCLLSVYSNTLTIRFCETFTLACDYLKTTADTDAHGLEVLGTQ